MNEIRSKKSIPKINKKHIKINVDYDFYINFDIYIKVVENIIKYILYQCQQIPVPFEVLEREIVKWKESKAEEVQEHLNDDIKNENTNINKREYIKQKVLHRRNYITEQNFIRKRKRWIPKVEEIIKCYNSTLQIIRQELDKNDVTAILFALGGSPALSTFFFKISLCPNRLSSYEQKNNLSYTNMISLERKVLLGLFKAFSSNLEISSFFNGNFRAGKLWTLIQKREIIEDLSELKVKKEQSNSWIPKMNFKIPERAKIVEIKLNEKLSLSNDLIDMELTPCVNNKISHPCSLSSITRDKTNISLFHNNITKDSPDDAKICCDKYDLGASFLNDGNFLNEELLSNLCACKDKNTIVSEFMTPKHLFQDSLLPNGRRPSDMIETPVVFRGYSETPINVCRQPATPFVCKQPPTPFVCRQPATPFVCRQPTTPFVCRQPTTPFVLNPLVSKSGTPPYIKRLAESVNSIGFDNNQWGNTSETLVWYQCEKSMVGFIDLYLQKKK